MSINVKFIDREDLKWGEIEISNGKLLATLSADKIRQTTNTEMLDPFAITNALTDAFNNINTQNLTPQDTHSICETALLTMELEQNMS